MPRVAAQIGYEAEAGLEPAQVLPGQGTPHRASAAQALLAGRARPGRHSRIAHELRVLLTDEPEAAAVQHPPEGRQLGRDGPRGQRVRRLGPPDEAAQRPVAECGASERQAAEHTACQLAEGLARRTRALGDDLVELPGVGDRGGPQRVAKTGTELDAPGDPRRGRQPQQLPELGKRSGEAARPRVALEQLFLLGAAEPPPLPKPTGLDVEHRRVARLRQLVDTRGELVADPVAAEVDRRFRRQPGTARGRDDGRQLTRLEVREDESARRLKSAGSSAVRVSLRWAPRLAS